MSTSDRTGLILLALLPHLSALALEAPKPAQQAAIITSGQGPYFRLDLPITIYPGAAHVDLRDVRIHNAIGNPLPYAWLNNERVEARISSRAAAFYPLVRRNGDLPASAPDQPDVSLEFAQKPDGTLTLKTQRKPAVPAKADTTTDWIIDASRIEGHLLQARFAIADKAEGLFPLSIEGSDDLTRWHTINADAQIAALKRPDGNIERLSVDLRGSNAKFLRLRWQDAIHAPELKSVMLDSVQQNEVITPLQWTTPIAAATCTANSCDYSLPANTPLDSLRVNLAETNTLASITVFAQSPDLIARDYPRRHHPLYLLRHKRQSTAPSPAPAPVPTIESVLSRAVVYRLKQSNGEVRSEDIMLNGGIYTHLRLQTQGPISLLGQTAPTIEIATTPRTLLFLGRGSPPFSLHWGADDHQETALPLATLVPGYQPNKPLVAATATVDITMPPPVSALKQAPPVAKATIPPKATPTPGDKKWLWAALTVGLVILAGMAWSLFKGMAKSEETKSQ